MANKYKVELQITFTGEIVAESQAEAEDLAWTSWGETADAQIQYDGVNSIEVEDLGEICAECEDLKDSCECEGEGEA